MLLSEIGNSSNCRIHLQHKLENEILSPKNLIFQEPRLFDQLLLDLARKFDAILVLMFKRDHDIAKVNQDVMSIQSASLQTRLQHSYKKIFS